MNLAIVKPAKRGSKGDPNQDVTPNLQKAPRTGTIQLPLTVPAQLKREFKSYAAENDLSMSALFQLMWDEYRARHP